MQAEPTTDHSRRRIVFAQVAAYAVACLIVLPVAVRRWSGVPFLNGDILGWPDSVYWNAPLYLPLLLAAPAAWWIRRRIIVRRQRLAADSQTSWWTDGNAPPASPIWRSWLLALTVAAASFAVSAAVGSEFDDLPPGYHDEYSYLFQAKTYLAGRLSFPSHEAPRLFDQMHVLNEGRFASRYFPGTGLWMAPFVAVDRPYWGHWLAGALTAFLIFWVGRDMAGNCAGLVAGLLTAFSPGMAIFSNLLLAHQPTLVGLSLFLFAYLRWRTRGKVGYALLAGGGLTFAMLCRPMTAAGFALPFGIDFAFWLLRGGQLEPPASVKLRLRTALALSGPILLGFVSMFASNRAITGNGLLTPYQVYTDIYTPRHVYGFNNVERGEENLGPRVLDNYDRWAENLTGALAAKNVAHRTLASWNWTLGIVPLAMTAVLFVVVIPVTNRAAWLVFAAIISLHAVHIPYWYDGIMHWHYVFESGPLWALLFALVTGRLVAFWRRDDRPWMPVWWLGLVLATLVMNYGSFEPFWNAKTSPEIVGLRYARGKHAAFQNMIANHVRPRPAVVFVDPDPADRHIDFVVNDPPLDGDVLIARYFPEQYTADELRERFPGRALYRFDVRSGQLHRLP